MRRPRWWPGVGNILRPMVLESLTAGPPLRGRVHKVSIVAGGEVSVVLRFGGEETAARALNQGTLVELRELPAPPAKVEK
jgi:hypothetical protein